MLTTTFLSLSLSKKRKNLVKLEKLQRGLKRLAITVFFLLPGIWINVRWSWRFRLL